MSEKYFSYVKKELEEDLEKKLTNKEFKDLVKDLITDRASEHFDEKINDVKKLLNELDPKKSDFCNNLLKIRDLFKQKLPAYSDDFPPIGAAFDLIILTLEEKMCKEK